MRIGDALCERIDRGRNEVGRNDPRRRGRRIAYEATTGRHDGFLDSLASVTDAAGFAWVIAMSASQDRFPDLAALAQTFGPLPFKSSTPGCCPDPAAALATARIAGVRR